MFNKIAFISTLLVATGCNTPIEQVTANFQYSNAGNLGTQNAGLFEPGSLFLWDTIANQISFLEVIPLTPVGTSSAPADLSSSNVAGIELSGVPVGTNDDLLKASIGAQSTFFAKSAVREDYGRLISALALYTADLISQGADPDLTLRPRDPGIHLVLIRSVVRAESTKLSIGGLDATNPNSVVAVNVGELLSLNIRASSNISCAKPEGSNSSIKAPACFFNVAVFDPEYQEGNPRLQFLPRSADSNQLSSTFRSLR